MPRRPVVCVSDLLPVWIALLAFLIAPAAVSAGPNDVQLSAKLGWDGPLRSGRWIPLHVTASDPTASDARPRSVRLDLEIPQGGPNVMQLHQSVTIGPRPATFSLLIPFRYEGYGSDGGPTLTLRDAATGKMLARWPEDGGSDNGPGPYWDRLSDTEKKVIGVVGEWSTLDPMIVASGDRARAVQLPADRLPGSPLGYDLLDLLVLNRANVNRLDADAQQAIADWVRAGGTVLMWPGNDPIPAGPLADVLPCRVGRPATYPISTATRSALDLTGKFKAMQGSELTPAAGATPIQLWPADQGGGAAAVAYTRRVGFGRITVAPFDAGRFEFNSTSSGKKFYAALTDRLGLIDPNESNADNGNVNRYNYYAHGADALTRRLDEATGQLQDHLGDVPGAGRFGFSYVAYMVLGMMLLVGPVDWFVLKRLGRQPWTWVTTTGWIGLITVGALSVAKVFKSGDLHFNTVEMIDQADDRVVGRVAMAGLYSPKTTNYHLEAPPAAGSPATGGTATGGAAAGQAAPPPGWWSVAAGNGGGGRAGGGLSLDTPFHQYADANAPDVNDGFTVNVWNLRFLRGEVAGDGGDPLVKADLKVVVGPDGQRVVEGTVRNLSDKALSDVRVSVGGTFVRRSGADASNSAPPTTPTSPPPPRELSAEKVAALSVSSRIPDDEGHGGQSSDRWLSSLDAPVLVGQIKPGESAAVRAVIGPTAEANVQPGPASAGPAAARARLPVHLGPWIAAADLAARRSERLETESAAAVPEVAVVYATVVDPRPPAVLREPPNKERHEAFLRAVVRLVH